MPSAGTIRTLIETGPTRGGFDAWKVVETEMFPVVEVRAMAQDDKKAAWLGLECWIHREAVSGP